MKNLAFFLLGNTFLNRNAHSLSILGTRCFQHNHHHPTIVSTIRAATAMSSSAAAAATTMTTRRTSRRLQGLAAAAFSENEGLDEDSAASNLDKLEKSAKRASGTRASAKSSSANAAAVATTIGSKKRKTKSAEDAKTVSEKTTNTTTTVSADAVKHNLPSLPDCLARTRELQLIQQQSQQLPLIINYFVMGIDEAGRGPLAGPVVAAAAIVPVHIAGIIDSKKLTNEATREEIYEKIITSHQCQWAVAIVDAARIDEINILQATLQGMRMAATALMDLELPSKEGFCLVPSPDSSIPGCYVARGGGGARKTDDDSTNKINKSATQSEPGSASAATTTTTSSSCNYYALIDGNRLPQDMPCQAETMVQGDGREYCIAAASILAKVTRDRLMHQYDSLYPAYNLKQHKGYGTVFHMDAVRKHGASPIHRRSFAPLKHMLFDDAGKVVHSAAATAASRKEETTEKKRRGGPKK